VTIPNGPIHANEVTVGEPQTQTPHSPMVDTEAEDVRTLASEGRATGVSSTSAPKPHFRAVITQGRGRLQAFRNGDSRPKPADCHLAKVRRPEMVGGYA